MPGRRRDPVDQFKYQASLVEQAGGQLEAAALVLSNAEATAGSETSAQSHAQTDPCEAKANDRLIKIDGQTCTCGAGSKK